MSWLTILLASTGTVGLTLLFAEVGWFNRPTLIARLAPYQPGVSRSQRAPLSVASFRDVVAPVARSVGDRMARVLGVDEDPQTRLTRIHSNLDLTTLRVRQVGVAAASTAVGLIVAVTFSAPPLIAAAAVLGTPILGFLVVEQRLTAASTSWQRHLFLELPVVAEQLGMLIAAGWSLGASIGRIAERGAGACARDLARVQSRMRQGLSEIDALREWADLAGLPAVDSLVAILAMNRETSDLGRLISEEARSTRLAAHRELIEKIERRTQQVWIPVTVAALVPGVLLMAIPFMDALSLFST